MRGIFGHFLLVTLTDNDDSILLQKYIKKAWRAAVCGVAKSGTRPSD